jgi:SAM-dependent methyltransferase
MDRLSPGRGSVGATYWDGRAQRFADRLPVEQAATDPFLRRLRRVSGPATTVVDVGSGPGRFAVNLAPHVRWVTAVDPSHQMLEILRTAARERGVENLGSIAGRWEDVEVEPADVVFSSYVLPMIENASRFLEKLHATARRRAFLYLGAFSSDAVVDPLWRHFHVAPRRPGPSYLDAVAVLHELGIEPAVDVVEVPNRTRFATVADAARDYLDYLVLPDAPTVISELEGLLASWLVHRDGALAPPLRFVPAAIISWSPSGR